MSVHDKSRGYHSGAHDYVAGRPGYPPEATEWLCDVSGVAPGKTIVEIGSGTGKYIPTLQAVGETTIAVEPITEMLEQLVESFTDVAALAGAADPSPCRTRRWIQSSVRRHFTGLRRSKRSRRCIACWCRARRSASSGMGGTRVFHGSRPSPRSPIAAKVTRHDTAPALGGKRFQLRVSSSLAIGTCATTTLVQLNRSFSNAQCR